MILSDVGILENAVKATETRNRPFIPMPKQLVPTYTLKKIAISKSLASTLEEIG